MALYSQSRITAWSLVGPSYDLKVNAVQTVVVLEYCLTLTLGVASTYGLGRPANDGSVVQFDPSPLLADNPGDSAAQTATAIEWTVAPTVPTDFHRRIYLPGSVTAGVVWTFPRGLRIIASRGLVNWNIAASTGGLQINVTVDE